MKKILTYISLISFAIVTLIQCGGQKEKTETPEFSVLSSQQIDSIKQVMRNAPKEPVSENEVGVLETNYGTIVVKFFPKVAPLTVENFKRLANHGYYDGTWFHRVIPGFMIQGGDILSRDGDPSNDGMGGPGYTIPAEFSRLPHYRGRLSMARKNSGPNTAGSQFFIVQNPDLDLNRIQAAEKRVGYLFPDSVVQTYLNKGGTPGLDSQYTVFGEVIHGMDVVDKIANVQKDQRNHPLSPVIMTRVYVTERKNVALLN